MSTSELIALLEAHKVPVVIVGGIAMRLHESPRVTQDLDLAIASSATDDALRALYRNGYVLVIAVSDQGATLVGAEAAALEWVRQTAPGSLSFVARPALLSDEATREVPHERILVESQVDLLYDLTVPFGRLLHDAEVTVVSGVSVRYASVEHLLELKRARSDRSAADEADIAFLFERLRG